MAVDWKDRAAINAAMAFGEEPIVRAAAGACAFAAAAAFGLLVLSMLPAGILAINDDFGYLRSVVLTIQHGRPWTDAWLEPWSAGFSMLAALIFKATGSFYVATYGLLSSLAGVSFFAVCKLLASRGIYGWRAIVLTFLGLTFPTVLWKSLEFTGVALYVPCLLLVIALAENRRWGWFCLVWALALSTRQSALTWAVLPVAALLQDFIRFGRKLRLQSWLIPGYVPVFGIALYRWLGISMNKTHAQRVITDHMWSGWNFSQVRTSLLVGGAVLFVATGLGAMALRCFRGTPFAYKRWPLGATVAIAVILGGALFLNARDFVACDHAVFDGQIGGVYLKVVLGLAAIGWIAGPCSLRPVPLAGALAAMLALSLRGMLWDYYLLDVAAFSFFAVDPSRVSLAIAPQRHPGLSLWLAAGALFAVHLIFVAQFKDRLDRGYALCVLGSRALHQQRIEPSEASFLPFGLMGWYFNPYYVEHEGADTADVADFGRYLRQDTVAIAWSFSKLLRKLPDHDGILPADRRGAILGARFPYCWFFSVDVLLLHAPSEHIGPSKSPYPANYLLPFFPEDDAGWRALIPGIPSGGFFVPASQDIIWPARR